MIVETLLISFIIGKIRGGKLINLEGLKIKAWYIFIISLTIEILSLILYSRGSLKTSIVIEDYFFYIHIIVYSLLIIGLFLNLKEEGVIYIFVGSLLNFLPILLNNGKMPVSLKALEFANLSDQIILLKENKVLTHYLLKRNTKLPFLADIIPIAKPYPLAKIISIGDIFMFIGLFILIQHHLLKESKL